MQAQICVGNVDRHFDSDAAVGDLKATLDKMHVGVDEQKELLSVVESVRPQVVEKR